MCGMRPRNFPVTGPYDSLYMLWIQHPGTTRLQLSTKILWVCQFCADMLECCTAGESQPPPELSRPMCQVSGLRYGENPHQPAAFYADLSLAEHGKGGIATALLHHGKEVCAFSLPPSAPTPSCCMPPAACMKTDVHMLHLWVLVPSDQPDFDVPKMAGGSAITPKFLSALDLGTESVSTWTCT